MNRSFTQKQEIDCSCFDFDIKRRILPYHPQEIPKPFVNARELNINFQKNQKQKLEKKFCLKKSLKRKEMNQSIQLKKQKFDKVASKNDSSDWITDCKQNRWVTLAQGSIIEKQKKQNRRNLDQINIEVKNPSKFKHRPNVVSDLTNFNSKKEEDFMQLSKAKSYLKLFQKQAPRERGQFKKNKTYIKQSQLSQVDSYSKTIKKRHSVVTSIFNLIDLTQGRPREDAKRKIDEQSIQNLKRVSIRGDTITSSIPKYELQYIYPKQIESFEEENFSAAESEVIEKGRYTWAPDGSKKIAGQQFISSLHIRETDRISKLSNRISKMVSGII